MVVLAASIGRNLGGGLSPLGAGYSTINHFVSLAAGPTPLMGGIAEGTDHHRARALN